jgi:hypothetical protein
MVTGMQGKTAGYGGGGGVLTILWLFLSYQFLIKLLSLFSEIQMEQVIC